MKKYMFYILCMAIMPGSMLFAQNKNVDVSNKRENCQYFRIALRQPNSAYAYSINVIMDDSLTRVINGSGLVGEKPETLWTKKNIPSMVDSIRQLLQIARLDTLKRYYRNKAIIDGMVILFEIDYQGKKTKVQLDNIWLQPLYNLTVFINDHLPSKFRLDVRIPN